MARTIVITGASDGIGAVAARALAAQGDEVVVVGRTREKTEAVAADVGGECMLADFSRLADVRRLADELRARHARIDVLMNNAGGLLGTRELTVDGFEKTFQVNHLAGFLLTALLLDTLIASQAAVINTSSAASKAFGRIEIDDLEHARGYRPLRAYGDAKLANVLHAVELHRRFHARGLSAVAVHPGNVATNFASETTSRASRMLYRTPLNRLLLVTPERGAEPLLRLANGRPGVDWQSGGYYSKLRKARPNGQANDMELVRQLWARSAEMVGMPELIAEPPLTRE